MAANGQSISVIDARKNQEIANIRGFTNPPGIAVNPLTDNVYVSDFSLSASSCTLL